MYFKQRIDKMLTLAKINAGEPLLVKCHEEYGDITREEEEKEPDTLMVTKLTIIPPNEAYDFEGTLNGKKIVGRLDCVMGRSSYEFV